MAWVRLDEEFPDHPKVVTAGPLAGWLHVCALAYCNRHLTDGFVPHAQIARLVNFTDVLEITDDYGPCDVRDVPNVSPYDLANRLVSLGMWEERQGGYLIHDYLDYQPSRAEIHAQRKVKSEAGRLGGRRSGESRRSRNEAENEAENEAGSKQDRSTPRSRNEANAEAKGQAKTKPDPDPDPDPDPFSSSSSSSLNRVAPASADDDDEEESETMNRARSAIAERRIDALARPPINVRAYRSKVLRGVEDELGDEIRAMVATGQSAESIADALEPLPAAGGSPYPTAGTVAEPVWDETTDDAGNLVVVPRRAG